MGRPEASAPLQQDRRPDPLTPARTPAGIGLYVHVPFCASICSYCHFERTAVHDPVLRGRYVDGVLRELDLRLAACGLSAGGRRAVDTCYLGGGTPSTLEPDLMRRLLEGVFARVPAATDLELTAEANPENLTPQLAEAWRRAGIERVSLGVQSLQDPVLRRLGRRCDAATARRGLAVACAAFARVSADWILGPGVDPDGLLRELQEAVDLGVEHFSLYLLELHEGTPLAAKVSGGRLRLPPDAVLEEAYLRAAAHLAGLGIRQYEVANFARPGAESRHNRRYWARRPFLGLGPGAHGHWARRRTANHGRVATWLQEVEGGRLPEAAVDPLTVAARRLERLILGLRTVQGIPLSWLPAGALDLRRGQAEGLWTCDAGRLALTGRGFLRIDTIEAALARSL